MLIICCKSLCKLHTFLKKIIILPEPQFSKLFPEFEPDIFFKFSQFLLNRMAKIGYPFFVNLVYSKLKSIFNILNVVIT